MQELVSGLFSLDWVTTYSYSRGPPQISKHSHLYPSVAESAGQALDDLMAVQPLQALQY